jgi:hypothetical protein
MSEKTGDAMPDLADWADLVDWIYELCAVNSGPDVDLDEDDDEVAVAWDENAGWGEDDEAEDDDGAEGEDGG